LFFFVDLAGDLPLTAVFEDDLRFAAGFDVVSATSVGIWGIVTDSAISEAVVSDSTSTVAAASDSTFGAEVALFPGFSCTWLFLLDLAGDLASAGAFEDDLRFAAGFDVVSPSSVGGFRVVSDSAISWAVISDSTVG
jgi:hypothetical protein